MVVSLYRPWGQRTTILQKNTYNFNSGWGGHQCCGGGSGNGGLWAAFGITAGLSLLSNIFGGRNRGAQMNTTNQYSFYGQQQYMPYGQMPGYSPTYIPQQAGTQQGTNQMANLEKLAKGKNYVILDEGNGQFTVSFGNGESVTGDYATVRDAIFDKGNVVSPRAQAGADEAAQTAAASQAAQDGADPADTTEETDTTTDTTTGTTTRRGFSYPELPDELEWKKTANASYDGKTVDELVEILAKKGIKVTREELVNANPNAIINGRVVDVNKLDLPAKKENYEIIQQLSLRGYKNINIEAMRDGNNTYGYTITMKNKNGKEVSYSTRNVDDILRSLSEQDPDRRTPPPSSSANGTTSQQETGKKDYNTTTQHHSDNFTAYVQYDNPVTASGGSGYVIVNGKKYSSITGFGLNAARNKNSIEEWILKDLRKAGYTGDITFQRVE